VSERDQPHHPGYRTAEQEYTLSGDELQAIGDHARETIRNVLHALRDAEDARDLALAKLSAHHAIHNLPAGHHVGDQCPICKEVSDARTAR
jgi:hypothetical protein